MRLLLAAVLVAAAAPALAGDLKPDVAAKLLAWASAEHASGADLCPSGQGASVGMTAVRVLSSCWGKPVRVNTTTTARGTHEQWVYGGGYLYLTDGVVTSIQTSR